MTQRECLCLTSDLALRCLMETPGFQDQNEPACKVPKTSEALPDPGPSSDLGPGPVLGLVVALCCHHRCEWRHYVGQQFFRQRGLGAADFSALCRMSSWATCGFRPTNQDSASQHVTIQTGEDEDHKTAEETESLSRYKVRTSSELFLSKHHMTSTLWEFSAASCRRTNAGVSVISVNG